MPLTVEFQQALHSSHVPFGKWPFFSRVVQSSKFLNTALSPFDKYTRVVVDQPGSIDAFKEVEGKWSTTAVAVGSVVVVVVALVGLRWWLGKQRAG